jgi:hypothetical protein
MRFLLVLALGALLTSATPVSAGMPSPSATLTNAASMRVQSISFFLVVFLLSGLVIRCIWNAFTTDFPSLPRLSYPKALGLMGLWGLLFLLVLTMISGARERMTPGAWKNDGVTYALADDKKPTEEPPAPGPTEEERRTKLMALFGALAVYAAAHDGRFPPGDDAAIVPQLWRTPHPSGMRYMYRANCSLRDSGRILACEPELFGDGRLALFTSGDIRRMTSTELAPLLGPEAK